MSLAEQPALALLEFDSIAVGVLAGDAMVKRSPVAIAYAGTIHPGHYMVLVAGDVATVDEAFCAGIDVGGRALRDEIFLPAVHSEVVERLRGRRAHASGEALGVVETRTAAAAVAVADRALKSAEVSLVELRLADRLGGKGYCVFSGPLAEVEAAVEAGVTALPSPDALVAEVVIPQFHPEMSANLEVEPEFWRRLGGGES